MKSTNEIIEYLRMERDDAIEQHDIYKAVDKQAALIYYIKATTIIELLHEIEE